MDETSTHYTVLARRFRPQTFDEVIGQQAVAQALKNAIQLGRVAHAYLFTGARGVGKTSTARILAKALNCPNAEQSDPCNECEICQGISEGNDVDVLEIDGASNRGIDDIRGLRANVSVKPMRTKYKVYIIDEVHMLTKEAFNALLKTLEEPPPNVNFIFCTTEPNKVPDTILSRCQRFDFTTIGISSIIERLHAIAEIEGYQVEPAALELVARRAAGSMRDSQSLFDQLLAFGETYVTVDDVHRLLGTASDERLMAVVEALIQRQSGEALGQFDQALADGAQLGELVDQLIHFLRDLMILSCEADGIALLGASPESRSRLGELAESWGMQTIVAALQILAEAKAKMFRSTFGRALAEAAIVRISLLDELDQLGELVDALKSGALPTGKISSSSAETGRKPRISRAPREEPIPPVAPPVREDAPQLGSASVPATENAPEPEKKSVEPTESTAVEASQSEAECATVEFRSGTEREVWAQVLSHISDVLKDHVKAVANVAISGPNQLELVFPKSYHFSKQYCERPDSVGRLEKLASRVTGKPIRIAFRMVESDDSATEPEPTPATTTTKRSDLLRRVGEPIEDEFVEKARSLFGGTVVKVEGLCNQPTQED